MKYKFKFYGNESLEDSILISCSIFKLKNKEYRDIFLYLDGLRNLILYVIELNYNILIYFDKSIKDYDKFKELFNEFIPYKNVRFCKYIFEDFLDNENKNYHKNIFGVFVRLFPIFDENIKYKCLYISDIDLHLIERLLYVNIHIKKFLKSKYNIGACYKIGYEFKYSDLFNIPNMNITLLLNMLFKNHHYEIKNILFDFLVKLNNNDENIKELLIKKNNIIINFLKEKESFIKKDYSENQKIITNVNEMFCYGIDELFINKYFIPKILENNNNKIGIFIIYDRLRDYTYHILDKNLSLENFKKIYFKIFKDNADKLTKEDIFKKINYKLIVINGKDINEKIYNFYKILKRFIKIMTNLKEKYIKKPYGYIWIKNLLLHKYKGLYRQLFINNKDPINLNILSKYIKIYSLDEFK